MLNSAPVRLALQMRGEDFEWYQASHCDCYDPATRYLDRGCTACKHGYIYADMGVKRGLVQSERKMLLHPEFGLVRVSELYLTVFADDIPLAPYDRIVLTARTARARERITPGEDVVPHEQPVEMLRLTAGGTLYLPDTHYVFSPTTGAITWMTTRPATVYSVDYTYHPEYWFLADDTRPPRPTVLSDAQTPLRGKLSITPPEG